MAEIVPTELTRYDASGDTVSSTSGTARPRVKYLLKATTTAAADTVSIKRFDPTLGSIEMVSGVSIGTANVFYAAAGSAIVWDATGTVVFNTYIGDVSCIVYGKVN